MIETSSPVQRAISCPLRPRSRKRSGVKAFMWPSAANWTDWQHRNRTLAPRQESFTPPIVGGREYRNATASVPKPYRQPGCFPLLWLGVIRSNHLRRTGMKRLTVLAIGAALLRLALPAGAAFAQQPPAPVPVLEKRFPATALSGPYDELLLVLD